ncbi:DUF7557 family protein [Candidatus Nitrosocosmicus arcticus]|uniref:Uncharacterized protein n=1 Tax=Candidatus Nitrosocosmicus arcticus TaxID=2035267 RepID=A0A557SV20_9ARCH|nr:hypothetical protein [Candidatus Nitrosocosmicus arcticus]TVP40448.1 hypothetical protein NARC_70025 [Candidatus Nitrosocosmicus arcticus]
MSTIVIRKETRNKLKYLGRKEQTYDDIISELLEKIEGSVNSGKSTELKVL